MRVISGILSFLRGTPETPKQSQVIRYDNPIYEEMPIAKELRGYIPRPLVIEVKEQKKPLKGSVAERFNKCR